MTATAFSAFAFKGSVGRADLLMVLALAGDDAGRQEALALLLGFEPQPQTSVPDPVVPRPEPIAESDLFPETTLPKGVFRPYQLVSLENLSSNEEWQEALPDTTSAGLLSAADMEAWDENQPLPGPAPIVPWTRLWPRLRQAAARRHAAGIDLKRLTDCLAQGLPVRRLPRYERLAWPESLSVVLDFSDRLTPYWDDWHRLRDDLERHLHHRVSFYRLDGVPQRPLQKLKSGRPIGGWLSWPKLAAGDTLLLASDLGMVDPAHPWPGACWQSRLDEYRRQGVRVVVLAPVSARHLQPALVNCAALLRLSPDSSLRLVPRMPPLEGAKPETQYLHPANQTLLAMMSVATRVEPALLRESRACLPGDGRDAGLDGAIWCHPELDTAATACALSPWAVQKWRDRFGTLPVDLQQRMLDCLRNRHARLPQAIHHEETLLWHHLAQVPTVADEDGNAERARHFFIKMKNTLAAKEVDSVPNDARALQILLAGRHVEWVASTLGTREDYIGELSAAITQAEPRRLFDALPKGIDPIAWLKALPPQSPEQVMLVQNPDLSLKLVSATAQDRERPGTVPLAVLNLDRAAVLWAFADNPEKLLFRPWHWQTPSPDAPPRLPDLWMDFDENSEYLPAFYLHTGRHLLRFDKPAPLPQEFARGQDRYGLYVDLELYGVIQRFRWINPGEFLMGSPTDEPWRREDELQHPVILTQGFWLADSACTQELWMAVTGKNPSSFQDDADNPVETVNWNEVQDFIDRLNLFVPGLSFQLPTEAEWEYACRAGTTTPFSFGENIMPEQVNYNGNHPYAGGAKGLDRKKTVPVKSLPPNTWGLYEMHGNVWEWCADWYGDYEPGPFVDPSGPEQGSARVLRGGSWCFDGRLARSADRSRRVPAELLDLNGFRLALGRTGITGPESQARRTVAGRIAASERGGERIQKILARSGGLLGSRRNIENLIRDGRITINGIRAKLGDRCLPEDRIEIDGTIVVLPNYADLPDRFLLYYKAEGELVTQKDSENRPTVFDFLPPLDRNHWNAVGRMGADIQGLLLFTTNGELANRLNQILKSIECEYSVRVFGKISDDKLLQLTRSVNLEGEKMRVKSIQYIRGDGANRWFRLIMEDGRSGVVRALLESQGIVCNRIIRNRFGNIELPADMEPHSNRELQPDQLKSLMKLAGLYS